MNKEQKYLFGDGEALKPSEVYSRLVAMLRNKYYNIFRSNFKIEGLNYREQNYLMNKFYKNGTVAAFNIKHTDKVGFASWVRDTWDMYGEPETVNLINEWGSPLVPLTVQKVDKDVVIGYAQSNRKPIQDMVFWFIDRIAQVEMVINTNLHLQKIPFLIPIEGGEKSVERRKLNDLVNKIINNEIVIYAEGFDANAFQAVATQAPYLIDKLQNYKKDLENDLLTYLGVNNSGSNKIEQLQLAEVNSNNEEINLSDTDFQTNLEDFCKRISDVLGKTISITISQPQAEFDGEVHEDGVKPGSKADGEGEEE